MRISCYGQPDKNKQKHKKKTIHHMKTCKCSFNLKRLIFNAFFPQKYKCQRASLPVFFYSCSWSCEGTRFPLTDHTDAAATWPDVYMHWILAVPCLHAERVFITQTRYHFIHQHQSADEYPHRSALVLSKNRQLVPDSWRNILLLSRTLCVVAVFCFCICD